MEPGRTVEEVGDNGDKEDIEKVYYVCLCTSCVIVYKLCACVQVVCSCTSCVLV